MSLATKPNPPVDQSHVAPTDQGGLSAPDATWPTDPKDQRTRFLQKAEEAASARKELETSAREKADLERQISERERELQYQAKIIASLQPAQPVAPQYTQPYTPGSTYPVPSTQPTSPGVPVPPVAEEFNAWDPVAATRFIDGRITSEAQRFWQAYQEDQKTREAQHRWEFGLSTYWSAQIPSLMRQDPSLTMEGVQKLFDRARATGIWDLQKVYLDLNGDRLREADRVQMRAEEAKRVEEDWKKTHPEATLSSTGSPLPPPVMGPGGPIPRGRVKVTPTSYGQATREGYDEFKGKIVSTE